jgi:hypothetical protein
MEKLARDKPVFIGLSCLSLACLIGSFAYPLQKMEIWEQKELGGFNIEYKRRFILTEDEQNYPYGFDERRAHRIGHIYHDYKLEKISLLIMAVVGASTAMRMGSETCIGDEIDAEVEQIKSEGRKQLILEGIKHRLAMASKSQRLLFMDEMKALIEEFGSPEGEILESDEVNATDKFTNAGYLFSEGHPIDAVVSQTWGYQPGTAEHAEMKRKFEEWQTDDSVAEGDCVHDVAPLSPVIDEGIFRSAFPESMDRTTWKAVCKAMGEGVNQSDIVKDVLGCTGGQSEVGGAYLEYLKSKFWTGEVRHK